MIEPARVDPLVATMSAAIGGPRGRHAYGHLRWMPATAVLVGLTALTCAVAVVQKTDCAVRGWGASFRFTHLCVSELPETYTKQGFDHPVLSTYWAIVTSKLTHAVHDSATLYVFVNALGFALLALLATFLLSRVRPDHPWQVAAFALSPALALTGLISTDLIAVATVAAALWAYSRGLQGLTGVLIGLGIAAQVYPVLLLGALLILAIRRREWGAWALTAGAAGFTWFVVNAPVLVTHGAPWRAFWSGLWHRGAGAGSFWMLIHDAASHPIPATTINVCAAILFIAAAGGIAALGVLSRREPTFAELGLLLVLTFVLVDKVYAPQNVLWLLPLAVLARPRWRDQLVWQGVEVLFFCTTWWNAAGLMSSGDGTAPMYDITVAARLAAELGLGALVVWSLLTAEGAPHSGEGSRGAAEGSAIPAVS